MLSNKRQANKENTLEFLGPDTYSSQIGTLVLTISILCLLLSLFKSDKTHVTKLFAIMLVAAIALFSSHWGTYFAAIFIVATAVTELEFLQNLAAIIRKDENYFNYRKEALSREDAIKRKLQEEIEQELDSVPDTNEDNKYKIDLSQIQDLSRPDSMRLSFDVEDKALSYASSEFGSIERGVRLRTKGKSAEYDGLKTTGEINQIFEVKWTRNNMSFPFMHHSIRRAAEIRERHKEITGKDPEVYLLLVTNTKTSLSEVQIDRLQATASEQNVSLRFYSLSEIGFDVTHEIA
ncbi:hypothetical protein OA5_20820 [Vibrio cyclitrophicus 1F111]|nr:hypothetical protein OA5_20820 [Vibrio cyclitrophicus 1F111]